MESARDSGKWKTPGTTGTGDLTTSSPNITNFTGNIANGQAMTGVGITAGSFVVSGGGTSTLVLNANITTPGTGIALAGAYTTDSTHPAPAGHDLMRDAVPTGLFA